MESWKDQHLFEMEIFRSILNVFTVNIAGFNAYLRGEFFQQTNKKTTHCYTVVYRKCTLESSQIKTLHGQSRLPGK